MEWKQSHRFSPAHGGGSIRWTAEQSTQIWLWLWLFLFFFFLTSGFVLQQGTASMSPCRSPSPGGPPRPRGGGTVTINYHHLVSCDLGLAPPAARFHSQHMLPGPRVHQQRQPSAVRGQGRAGGLPPSLVARCNQNPLPPRLAAAAACVDRYGSIESNRINIMEMEPAAAAATAIYPLHRCKTIHLVRHAQGVHNVEGETDHGAYMKPDFFDARLTALGWSQVDRLREHVKKSGLVEKIELVISSPLLRTMQTAVGVFGGQSYSNGVSVPPLMVEHAADSGRPAVSSLNCPPFLAVEACRERLGVHPCDRRRSITEYRTLFPAIDFSLIENDEDVLWVPDVRETFESLTERGMKFIDWLWTREEREIAIVTHSGLLCHTLRMYSKECHPTVRQEVSKYFANCELRSLVLVDRSMLGSDRPTYNYPGKIPAGLDLPSGDVAADKKQPCIEESQDRTRAAEPA